nr:palmitoyl-acyl carrier protein thioesterase, chloroplastic [Tanacetum cinerariifolium]
MYEVKSHAKMYAMKVGVIHYGMHLATLEAILNHLKTIGVLGDGLGSSPIMFKKNLIWVMTKVQMPRWSDLDLNLHVNNVKYIGWILESVPMPILESYELASMTLEYRRECKKDNVLQSTTYVLTNDENRKIAHDNHVYCQHVLRLDGGDRGSGSENMKGKTKWRPKYGSN